MGMELSACGVNLNYSPVCDVLSNPDNEVIGDRCFGRDQQTIKAMIPYFIKGLREEKVLSCAKHFPGHGDTISDSHFDLPILDTSLDLLKEREFLPFIEAINSGVDIIMMGHLLVNQIDSKYPASLSRRVHEILIKKLHFKGLIFSDDMQMEAITKNYPGKVAMNLALSSGSDVLIYRDMEKARKYFHLLKESLVLKEIDETLIEEKVHKILHFKEHKLNSFKNLGYKEIPIQSSRDFLKHLNQKLTP
jgi:beta-N-acetylhexosaminidase